MAKWICWAAALVFVLPAAAKSKAPGVPDQTIATWTEKDAHHADAHTEHTLTLHAGTLQDVSIEYSQVTPDGMRDEHDVKLARIKAINTNELQEDDGTVTYRVGVDSKGRKDITVINYVGRQEHTNRMWGFLSFDANEKAQRDEVYAKLCTLVPAGVCTGEWK